MEQNNKIIDIEKAFRTSNSKFFKSLPTFIISIIKKIAGEEEINKVIFNNRTKSGVPFINGVLSDWNVSVEKIGAENIPSSGRFIFASNHPVGGMDALAIYQMIYEHFPKVISPANEMLNIVPNFKPLIFGINVFGKTSREKAIKLNELYESDTQIMIFPAGEVSRRRRGIISDIPWQKSFITKAIEHRRDIIPVFIAGRNSNLFYIIANLRKFLGIKMYIETMFLPYEMLKQRNSSVILYIGEPIKYQTFTQELTHFEWAQRIRSEVYSLPDKLTN